jgi:putative SOS response-associated peptidase YedK
MWSDRRMCNRARYDGEPETLREKFGAGWATIRPTDNRFNWKELTPRSRAYVVRDEDGFRGLDIMSWDVLGGQAAWPMTNVRNLHLPQWRKLAANRENRCLIPLTEFCEWTPHAFDLEDGKKPVKGEMWFAVPEQPIFAVAGFWQHLADDKRGFTMVTCDPNPLVAATHPKAMITILRPEHHDRWLKGSYEDVVALQQPYPAELMTERGPVFPTRAKKEATLI